MLVRWQDDRVAGRPRISYLPEGEALAYVPTEIMRCVVFLGYRNKSGQEKFGGSAFWVSRPGPDDIADVYRPAYLVTAAHVIADMKADMATNDRQVRMRVNTTKGGQEWVDTPLRLWEQHPDYPKVDLAVLKTPLENQLWDHVCWPLDLIVKSESVDDRSDRKMELGDELFFAGLFWPHKGSKRNIPIVRIGNVAALRGEPIVNPDGYEMDAYLTESRSIGGLSGSPVFIDLYALKTAKQPTAGSFAAAHAHPSPSRFRLFGVVHGHFDWPDKEPDNKTADSLDSSQSKLGVNMGIAIVSPAERILEVIELFKDEEEKEASDFRKKRVYVVADSLPRPNVTYQVTTGGFEIPIPTEDSFSRDLDKASRKKD